MIEELKMIPCPKCGKPFPKRRRDLGYNYCCDCSTEKTKTCRIEDRGEGEDTYTVLTVMTAEEALALARIEKQGKVDVIPDQGPAPDYSTFEEQDENQTAEVDLLKDSMQLTEMEKEFAGMSERSLEEMERIAPLMDDDDEDPEELLDDD